MPLHKLSLIPVFPCTDIWVGDREVIGRLGDGRMCVIARLIEPEATPPKRKHRKKVFAPGASNTELQEDANGTAAE
jgi:hypothetical protein